MLRKLIVASVLAVAMFAGLQAGTPVAHAMPPTCTKLGLELKFTFLLNIHRNAPEAADVVHSQVTTVVGPAQPGGQPACAPTGFHLRLALQYHKRTGWKTIATAATDEGTLSVGTIVITHANRVCEAAWNGFRQWRLRLGWYGRNGINQFQRGRTRFYPSRSPGRRLRCFSA